MTKKTAVAATPEPESHCPNCGYCPHCGRANAQPYVPYLPYRVYPMYPWQQPWVVGTPYYGTITVTNNAAGNTLPAVTWNNNYTAAAPQMTFTITS